MSTKDEHGIDNASDRQVDDTLRAYLGGAVPGAVESRAQKHFDGLRDQMRSERGAWTGPKLVAWRPAWAGAGALCSLLVTASIIALFSQPRLTWAAVVARFKAVQFFRATVFLTENPLKQPEKIEIWMSADRRSRVHHRGRVFFGMGDKVVRVYDVSSRTAIDLERLDARARREQQLNKAIHMIGMMGRMEELSLDTVLQFFVRRPKRSAPLKNAEASIAEDMEVFDVTTGRTPEWMRIWVLKTSGLPIRLRSWDPRRGESVEVTFDYMAAQPDEAFDADAFEESLRRKDGRANRLYDLLEDPGGRAMTPEDVFEVKGYHMPTIVQAGRTEDGVFWVLSGKSRNRMPNGHTFDGFGRLTDSLGQDYLHRPVGHRVRGDLCFEYFIPFTYGTDYRRPESYTLTCWTQPDGWGQPFDIVGSVEVTEWQEGKPDPKPFRGLPDRRSLLTAIIKDHRSRGDWDRFDKLLVLIPGEPEANEMALFREKQRLWKLQGMRKNDEAFDLMARLYPLIEQRFAKDAWRERRLVVAYIQELVTRSRRDDAERILRERLADLRAFKHPQALVHFAGELYRGLMQRGLSDGSIDVMFGFDVMGDAEIKKRVQQFGGLSWVTVDKDPRFDDWRDYAKKVAELYDRRPLPEALEFLTDVEPYDPDRPSYGLPLPGHEGYKLSRIKGGWLGVLLNVARSRGRNPKLIRVAEPLRTDRLNVLCVHRDTVKYADLAEQLTARRGVEIVDKSVQREVWVARYDGRKLPDWRMVRPLDAGHLGAQRLFQGGGTQTTVDRLLDWLERAANHGKVGTGLRKDAVCIVDETGLPKEPGENQSWETISLTHGYAFWAGEEAMELTKQWFEENFGITFHEEQRSLRVLEIRPVSGRAE